MNLTETKILIKNHMYKTKTSPVKSISPATLIVSFLFSFLVFFFSSNSAFACHITVCQILTDSEGKVITSDFPAGKFILEGQYTPGSDTDSSIPLGGLLPTTTWDTTKTSYSLNADLIGNDGKNDASCVTHYDLEKTSYHYKEVSVSGGDWETTLYNDQHNVDVNSIDDFFSYNTDNTNADGEITLTTARNIRTLVLLTKQKINHAPVITVKEPNPLTIKVDDSFVAEDHATVSDPDGDDTTLHASSSVNTTVAGTYTVQYTAEDSKGQKAEPKTLTVIVEEESSPICVAPLDVMVVFDRSDSMADDPSSSLGPEPLSTAKIAAKSFIDALVALTDKVGLVSFYGEATLDSHLTNNFSSVKDEIDAITVDGWTNVGKAISLADEEISLNGRTDVKNAIVLLSDGNSNRPTNDTIGRAYAIKKANEAKSHGIVIYSIALGNDLSASDLQAISSGDGFYFTAPTAADLKAIYLSIAETECERQPSSIEGTIFEDINKNAAKEDTEPGLSDWVVILKDKNGVASDRFATSTDGTYELDDVMPGTYNLCATVQTGFEQTTPVTTSKCHENLVIEEGTNLDLNFGFAKLAPVNHAPEITIVGANPFTFTVGGAFDPMEHATTSDPDGDAVTLYASSSVSTTTVGTYQVDYTAKDSHDNWATPKSLTVEVVSKGHRPQCSDEADNDGDEESDAADPACHTNGDPDEPYDPNIDDENSAPVAVIVAPVTANQNSKITLDGVGSYDLDGTVVLYTWNFGDGSAATSTTASTTSHTYTATSTYTVTLKVTDDKGAISKEATTTILVKVPPIHPQCSDGLDNDSDGKIDSADPACHTDGDPEKPYDPNIDDENSAPVAILALDPTSANTGVSITNDGKASYDLDGTIVLFEWNFGDGAVATSTASTTSHTYSNANTYTVTLKVTDNKGLTGNTTKTIVVSSPSGCSGNCGGGGGGGGGGAVLLSPTLVITNEKVEKGPISGTSIVSWTTNLSSDSRVVYGTSSVTSFPTGNEKYGYSNTTITVSPLVISHTMAISGLDPNLTYYFRPISKTSSLSATGKELVQSPSECYYLREFIKLGANNNPVEVKKLQVFLNEFEGASLPITGFYSIADFNAVSTFQTKYKADVIDPWGETPEGYVYLTTRKKVNEIYCRAAFPLDGVQTAEVNAYRALIESLREQGIVVPTGGAGEGNQAGLVNGTSTENELSELKGEGKTPALAATSGASVTDRGAFRNMLAGAYNAVSGAVSTYWLALILLALLIPTGFYARKMLKEEDEADTEI